MTLRSGRLVAGAVSAVALHVSFAAYDSANAACSLATPCASPVVDIPAPANGHYAYAWGVTEVNGVLTVVGHFGDATFNDRAYVWSGATNTAVPLALLSGDTTSYATGISADGATIVGMSTDGHTQHAVRWQNGTPVDLGTVSGSYSADATAVSDDGSTIVGYSLMNGAGSHAFRWHSDSQGTAMADLGTLGGTASLATGVSGDGLVVVGSSMLQGDQLQHAFRWTSAGGMQDLGSLGVSSMANGVSADGNVAVGLYVDAQNHNRAFRWESNVMSDLGTLGGKNSTANAASGDGSVVVGRSEYTNGPAMSHAFRWTQVSGMKDLNTLLSDAGVNMNGITLVDANALTRDGRFIAGTGLFAQTQEAYVVLYDDGIAGVSTVAAQQASLDSLAKSHVGVMAEQHGLLSPLLGNDKPIKNESYAGVFASGGSVGAGGFGQLSNAGGLTILGGVSYNQEGYEEAAISNGVSGALAVRYARPGSAYLTPYAEAGGWLTRGATLNFDRSYANGAGVANANGDANGDLSYLYARAGLILNTSKGGQIVGAAEIGRERMETGAYSEAAGAGNPFAASFSSGTDVLDIAKIRVSWSEALADRVDMTLWTAGAWAFGSETNVTATIGGFGTMTAAQVSTPGWVEYGARFGYKVTDVLTLDAFANGIAGSSGIDTAVHGGGDLRVKF